MSLEETGTLRKTTTLIQRAHGGYSCPECTGSMAVIDSRPSASGGVRRRRECSACGKRSTTYEIELGRYHDFLTVLDGLAEQARSVIRAMGAERDRQ